MDWFVTSTVTLPVCQSYEPKITDLSSRWHSVDGWGLQDCIRLGSRSEHSRERTQLTANPRLGFLKECLSGISKALITDTNTLLALTLSSLSLSGPQTARIISIHPCIFSPSCQNPLIMPILTPLTLLCWIFLWKCRLYPPCGQRSIFWEGR